MDKDDDPSVFRQRYESMQEEIEQLGQALSEKIKLLQTREKQQRLKDEDHKSEKVRIRNSIEGICDWLQLNFNFD